MSDATAKTAAPLDEVMLAMDVVDTEEDQAAEAQAKRLRELAQKVEKFVEGEGTVEGATFEE